MDAIAEGYPTARAAHCLARQHSVVTPVITEVHAMLYEAKPPSRRTIPTDVAC